MSDETEVKITIDRDALTWGDYEALTGGGELTPAAMHDFVKRCVVAPDYRTLRISDFGRVIAALSTVAQTEANAENLP